MRSPVQNFHISCRYDN